MALLDIRRRSGYLFLAVMIGHVILISAQVNSRSPTNGFDLRGWTDEDGSDQAFFGSLSRACERSLLAGMRNSGWYWIQL